MALLLVVTAASAQIGVIGAFVDTAASGCVITDAFGFINVYLLVINVGETIAAVDFRVDDTAVAMTAAGATVNAAYLYLGTFRSGVSVSFGGCVGTGGGPINLGSVNYIGDGTETGCPEIKIIEAQANPSGMIEHVACDATSEFYQQGLSAIVQSAGNPCNCTLKPETTTWGAIKDLYR